MTDSTFEALLTARLREYADGGVRPIDRYAVAEGTIASGRARGIGWRWTLGRSRRPLQLLLVALLIAAIAAAAVFVGSRLLAPTPPGDPVPRGAIFLRYSGAAADGDVDIVAVTPDGRERVVRRMDSSTLESGGFTTFGSVSQDGWVAIAASLGLAPRGVGSWQWALVDLEHPDRAPTFIPYQPVIGGAWGPNGLFATTRPEIQDPVGLLQVVDAATGSIISRLDLHLPGGGPDLIWAADGSGLVGVSELAGSESYVVAPLDGGPATRGIPRLAARLGAQWLAPGGATLLVCAAGDCPARPDGFVGASRADGFLPAIGDSDATRWYDGQIDGAGVSDASFSADGRSVWILLDQVEGGTHTAVIARADAPGEVRVVGTVGLGPGVARMWIEGVAPDDSSVAIRHWIGLDGQTTDGPIMLVSTTGRVSPVESGSFIGFMSGDLAEPPAIESSFEPTVAATPGPVAEESVAASPTPLVSPSPWPEPGLGDVVATKVADMQVFQRYEPSAIALGDGRVLVTGGLSDAPGEVVDPSTGQATITDPGAVTGDGAGVLLRDGRVLLVLTDGNHIVSSVFLFDPEAMSWASLDAPGYEGGEDFDQVPSTIRRYPTLSLLHDGRVLLSGGRLNVSNGRTQTAVDSATLFDPEMETFAPTGAMVHPRVGHSATTMADGRVLIAGGWGSCATPTEGLTQCEYPDLRDAEIYDPSTGIFTATGGMSRVQGATQGMLLPDGRVLVLPMSTEERDGDGGIDAPGPVEIYDPSAGTFALTSPTPHRARTAALLPDGRVFLTSQWSEPQLGGDPAPLTTWAGVFDPATGLSQAAPAPPVGSQQPAVLSDGRVVLVGGPWAELYTWP